MNPGPGPARRWVPWVAFPALAAGFVLACCWLRPSAFTSGDGVYRYLPLIKAHTDSLLAGAPLRMLWGLGAGWSPAQSGEMGLAYLPYHAANLIARLLGQPLALLEVNAALHLGAAGLVAWHLLPAGCRGPERAALALAFVVLPAPVLLGFNWPSYLSPYPWFLALVLVALRPPDGVGRRIRAFLLLLAGFYLSSHVQVFALGCALLLLALACDALGEAGRGNLKALFVAGLPFALPLAYVRSVAQHAQEGWRQSWEVKDLLVHSAQPLGVALKGLALGNLAPAPGFKVFGDVSWTGIGLFFAPWLLAAALLALWRRKLLEAAFWALCLVLLGARTFPFLKHAAVGPLQGFRWSWKLMVLLAPLSLVAMVAGPAWSGLAPRARAVSAMILALLCAGVSLRGVPFVLSNGAPEWGRRSVPELVQETRRILEACGLPPGTRLALVDAGGPAPGPIPMAVLVGNGPLLAGYESVHLFEPLDDAKAAADRFELSSLDILGRAGLDRPETELLLTRIGVQALVSAGPLPGPEARSAVDSLGRRTYIRPVHGALPWTYPWAVGPRPLLRLPEGRLRTLDSEAALPQLINSRIVVWQRQPDGTWIGTPEGVPGRWWLGGLAVLALVLAYSALAPRTSLSGPPPRPSEAPAPGSAAA